jgi:hypothetical protein
LAALLGLWSPNAWHPPEKHGSLLASDEPVEQAPNSNVPAIITTLTRLEIIFQFPLGYGLSVGLNADGNYETLPWDRIGSG